MDVLTQEEMVAPSGSAMNKTPLPTLDMLRSTKRSVGLVHSGGFEVGWRVVLKEGR